MIMDNSQHKSLTIPLEILYTIGEYLDYATIHKMLRACNIPLRTATFTTERHIQTLTEIMHGVYGRTTTILPEGQVLYQTEYFQYYQTEYFQYGQVHCIQVGHEKQLARELISICRKNFFKPNEFYTTYYDKGTRSMIETDMCLQMMEWEGIRRIP